MYFTRMGLSLGIQKMEELTLPALGDRLTPAGGLGVGHVLSTDDACLCYCLFLLFILDAVYFAWILNNV